jgi:hypothetical protein
VTLSTRLLDRVLEEYPHGAAVVDVTAPFQAKINPRRVPRCDFCFAALRRRWVRYGCGDFTRTMPGRTTVLADMVGPWAACRRCVPLVDARSWRRLASRALAVRPTVEMPPLDPCERSVYITELVALWLTVERNLTGERELVKP